MGKGQASQPFTKSLNKDEQEVVSGKQNVKAACPKDKMEYKLFSSPGEEGKREGDWGGPPLPVVRGWGFGVVTHFLLLNPPPPPPPTNPLFTPTTLANRTQQHNVFWTYKIHLHPSISCSWLQPIQRNMRPSLAEHPDQVCPSVFQTRQQID